MKKTGLVHKFSGGSQLPEHQALVAVVETGSFSDAAKALSVTKSCVSKQIGRLEERLGVRLLQRTTRRVHLTEVGGTFYDRCVRILEEIDAAENLASRMHNTPIGTLRIAAPVMFGQRFLAPIVCDFLEDYPQLSADLVYTNMEVDIVGDGFDLNVHIGDLPDSTLVARSLMSTRTFVCGSPSYFEEHGTPEVPRDLKYHQCLQSTTNDPGTDWRFHGPQGEITLKLDARVHCNHLKGLLIAAQKGIGVAALPDYIAAEHIEDGSLKSVLDDWTEVETTVWLVYPHSDLSAKTRLFIDFLVERMGEDGEAFGL